MSKGNVCLLHVVSLWADMSCEASSPTITTTTLIALQVIPISVQLKTLPHYPASAYSCNSIFLSDFSEHGSEALVISGAASGYIY